MLLPLDTLMMPTKTTGTGVKEEISRENVQMVLKTELSAMFIGFQFYLF